MNSIGFRASPTFVHYAIVSSEGQGLSVLAVSSLVVPAALAAPEQLAFIRTTLLDIIGEYHAEAAGIRTTEPVAQRKNTLRVNIEGVIQELIASGAVVTHFAGPIATIARLLDVPRNLVKSYVNGSTSFPGTAKWSTYGDEQREALLVALAAQRVPTPRLVPLMPSAEPVTGDVGQ